MNHADIKQALLIAAKKRGRADFGRKASVNPYDYNTQGDLYRAWEREYQQAKAEALAAQARPEGMSA